MKKITISKLEILMLFFVVIEIRFKPSGYENLPLTPPEADELIDPLKKKPVEPPYQPTRIQQELGPKIEDLPVIEPVQKPNKELPQPVISPIIEVSN